MRGAGLQVQSLSCGYPGRAEVLKGIQFEAPRGQITALLGPNGSGKSTLLKALIGLVDWRGQVLLDGESLSGMAPEQRAQHLAYVPQKTLLSAQMPVHAVVELGRFAHRSPMSRQSPEDRRAVEQAMTDTGVSHLAKRPFPQLSGGEQQRVLLARALATGADTFLLDEPTSALDVRQALILHRLLRELTERGACVLVVLHGLSEARGLADRAVLLHDGGIQLQGPVEQVVASDPIRTVYGVELLERSGLEFRLPGETS